MSATGNTTADLPPGEVLLRLPQVLAKTGRGRTAVLDDVREGRFPPPIKIGSAALWPASEVERWIHERIRQARTGGG
jgi:prophage regulatory protein